MLRKIITWAGRRNENLDGRSGWARDMFMSARALAMMFVRKHGWRRCRAAVLQVVHNGLTVTFYPNRSPVLLTIDAPPGARV